jgi:hypothetical protein
MKGYKLKYLLQASLSYLKREGKGKGKSHPRTGHEGPEGD